MHQDSSAPPESAPRRDIELESFAHKSSGGFVRRLTLPDGRWWFPAADICKGLGLADVQEALADHVPESMRTTLGSLCALHRMPIPNQPTWDGTLPLLSRRGVEALLGAPAGAGAAAFAPWLRATVMRQPDRAALPAAPEDAIEISDFVHAATGARIRRLTMPDGTHWFPAADVCRNLGYLNSRKTVADHVQAADRDVLEGVTGRYTLSVPAGRTWQRNSVVVNLRGLIALVNASTKPEAAPFKRWVSDVVATIQREGCYELPGVRTVIVDSPPPAVPVEPFPLAEFLSFVQRSEERQERMLDRMSETQSRFTEALAALLAKPGPLSGRQQGPGAVAAPPAAQPPPSAPEILADWQARFEASEEVWAVAAYIIPEMLIHGELVASGERIGARLGIAPNRVHRCLGHLRRHGCIHQVGLTPGAGCPVYVFA
ncbi:Bro-N domain-containing protein [Streptacidiphilus sp. N1-3]|uniref:Bro-N domain-containing protein n=1 Tax=Streptacidiphilus alkalitolerans TaxID=3342712 RepID=A0ABV6WZ63_9ACTN